MARLIPSRLFVVLIAVTSLAVTVGCGPEEEGDNGERGISPGERQNECSGESEEELCDMHDFDCGQHTVDDECGDEREIDCGDGEEICEGPDTCGGGDEPGVCGCTPETDVELCDEEDVECGILDPLVDDPIIDSCEQERQDVDCGSGEEVCGENETCGGGGEPGICGCTPETEDELCDEEGIECGSLDDFVEEPVVDSCGEQRDDIVCGSEEEACGEFETCGGGGEPGVCGCTPETEDELCDEAGYECGTLGEVTDSCGEERFVDSCGLESEVCDDEYDTCGGGEDPGVCGCTPTTCEQEGILCGEIEDGCGDTIECDLFCADEIDVGDQHACAVGSETVKCWGRNDYGQLGVGDTSQRDNPAHVLADDEDPDDILESVKLVASGTHHSCALLEDQTVRCWGSNDFGQLGDTSTNDSLVASEPTAEGAVDIDAGANHTCAIVEVEETFDDDGNPATQYVEEVHCWGHNSHGQLGDPSYTIGTTRASPTPIDDAGGQLEDHIAVDVSAGDYHTCALFRGPFEEKPYDESNEDHLEDSVWCWGDNRFGQVDPLDLEPEYQDLNDQNSVAYAINLDDDEDWPLARDLRRIDDGIGTAIDQLLLTTGADHTCIHDGETEVTTCQGAFVEDPGDVPDETCEVDLTLFDGMEEDDDENLQETFENYDEQLASHCSIRPHPDFYAGVFPLFSYTGDGEDGHDLQEVFINHALDDQFDFEISDSDDVEDFYVDGFEALQIESGTNHICALVDHGGLSKSNIYCMGKNKFGQLGEASNQTWATFHEVHSGSGTDFLEAVQISAGRDLSCALLENSNIKCWGSNAHGQIGNENLEDDESFAPFDVLLPIAGD